MTFHSKRMGKRTKSAGRNQIATKNENNSAVTDIEYAIQINRWLLKPLGVWPITSSSSCLERFFSSLLIVICCCLLAFIIIPGSLFTFVKVKNPAVRLKLTGALSFCVMAIMKYYSLVFGRRNVNNCIDHMIDDWQKTNSTNDRNTMLLHAQFGRYGSFVCAIFMYGGGLFYAGILPHVSASVKNEKNMTVRPLAYPSYYILFDHQNSPAHEIVFITHCFCAFVMHSITSATCSLAVVFVMHACGQLQILGTWLKDLIDGKEYHKKSDRFFDIIEQHVRTLRFVNNVEKTMSAICLVEIVGCTLNICFLGYYLLLEWEQSDAVGIMTYTILLISFIFNIFLFCYIGELLTEECEKVGETTYMIDWYRLPGKEALALILMIATAQNPVKITAGKFIELSLNSFCTVIRTSVAYLNILRTMMA